MPVSFSNTPFVQALQRLQAQGLLPTTAGTYGLEQIPAEIRERALFSARVANTGFLQQAHELLTDALSGGQRDAAGNYIPGTTIDQAAFRLRLKTYLQSIGYTPGTGADGLPVAVPGSLRDLTSDNRLNLIYQTNLQLAQGYGGNLADQSPARLDAWPAQELYRLEPRKERRPWGQRWNEAIQRIGVSNTSANPQANLMAEEGMIALKNDPIWSTISRFGLPYPPYDFNSGMWVRDVSRAEAIAAGVMEPDAPSPEPLIPDPLNAGLQSDVGALAQPLQEALAQFGTIVDGVFQVNV